MGEAKCGEPHNLACRLVADHIEVMFQGCVLCTLKVHQLRLLVDPDLQAMGTYVTSVPRPTLPPSYAQASSSPIAHQTEGGA